ncbi:5-carboxymethyl-2-hydroxymuconate isomerase [Xenophilus arseniciresistens]|uniref:5-carboxymethyl-2-hydroxymuconate isomerase n=1 Tax=Xenophilus arseniciresistens TaxID=1283306 RepID=A0AAE3T1B3_9BURK|nr:5-carboxymethyl-2-hydroxymuconate isomerase [Xenophilus arseniciresistens]MDA7417816.1 5-carboxymethyl-2-hydroxymuconate isomerase [Xenophilus arseniciresistens]
MPHIVIEHTTNLPPLPWDDMLAAVTSELAGSAQVEDEADLKARVLHTDAFRVGLAGQGRAFIHVTVRILAGRSAAQKRDFSDRVTRGMLARMPPLPAGLAAHLSVEVVDMDRESYRKVRLG